MDNINLLEEAMALHGKLSTAYHAEAAKRDRYFNKATDPVRVARLEYLTHKAADRWRRRQGIKPIWGHLPRP